MSVCQMITSHKMREGARDGGRDGRAESGGMAAKKLEPHTEMWGKEGKQSLNRLFLRRRVRLF